jgi:hypothetical protein
MLYSISYFNLLDWTKNYIIQMVIKIYKIRFLPRKNFVIHLQNYEITS